MIKVASVCPNALQKSHGRTRVKVQRPLDVFLLTRFSFIYGGHHGFKLPKIETPPQNTAGFAAA